MSSVRTIPNDQEGVACHAIAARQFLEVYDLPMGWTVTELSTVLNATQRGNPALSVRKLLRWAEIKVPTHEHSEEPVTLNAGINIFNYGIVSNTAQISVNKLDGVIAAICAVGRGHVCCLRWVREENSWFMLNDHRKNKMSCRAAQAFISRRGLGLLNIV